jgi:hypothetical protein
MGRVALLRAVTTGDHAHSSSGYAMLTGQSHVPMNRENANPGPPNDWPTMGAVVKHLKRQRTGLLPNAMRLPMHIFNTDQSIWPGLARIPDSSVRRQIRGCSAVNQTRPGFADRNSGWVTI